MSLMPWRPFRDLDNIFEEDDWFLPLVSTKGKSKDFPVNLYETEKELVIEVGLPGIDTEKTEISINDDILEIKGTEEKEKEEKNKNYWKKEIYKSSFEKLIKLPIPVEEDNVNASYENGIMKVVMPKKKKEEPKKRIQINKK